MDNQTSVSYADDWKSAYSPVRFESVSHASEDEKPRTRRVGFPLLIIIQISVCALAVLGVYLFSLFGEDLYKSFQEEYKNAINDEILMNSDFEHSNLQNLFDAVQN